MCKCEERGQSIRAELRFTSCNKEHENWGERRSVGEGFISKRMIYVIKSLKFHFKRTNFGIFKQRFATHVTNPEIIKMVNARELRHH